ncbi:YusW family protein [Halalkalibacter krulwichiae]|uniref:Beta-lactamase-inhibitor-like PepSY-like domain-containing protein n=1 Tax=Halalkalibacter krulwichiae TaxID=199441 RepID=A0A1X9M9H7_9BACI|nr:YusW family protein [Halalkalibacter krulwichiae]ARK29260.1 hypothetical protein BkAM31D_04980 [Halalkalibacter krulwichiae]
MKMRFILTAFVSCLVVLGTIGVTKVDAAPNVIDFELEIELKDHTKIDIEYEVENNKIEAKYKVPGSATKYGQDALVMIEPLLKELKLTPNVNGAELKTQTLSIFEVNVNDIDEFELEIKFDNGQKVKID